MTPQLTQELRHALARQAGGPLQIEDPETHTRYVLVQLDVFERLQRGADYDMSEPDPREVYPYVDLVMREDDLHDPALESYQHLSPDSKPS